MKTFNRDISACRHCQNYQGEGRRGGQCQQLGVPVNGSWKACSLAIPPFASDWKELEEVVPEVAVIEVKALSKSEMLASVERLPLASPLKMPIHPPCFAAEHPTEHPVEQPDSESEPLLVKVFPLSA